jgi:hypothetical protein
MFDHDGRARRGVDDRGFDLSAERPVVEKGRQSELGIGVSRLSGGPMLSHRVTA